MKTRSYKRLVLLAFGLLVIGLTLPCLWWVHMLRQAPLNGQLIDALTKSDTAVALDMVEAGADPNTRLKPTAEMDSPTAFMMACGAYWEDSEERLKMVKAQDPYLTLAMLRHGANINAKGEYGTTPLYWAVLSRNKTIIQQLLIAGADPNKTDKLGRTAISTAETYHFPDIVEILHKVHKKR